jgi:hypothetical protein
MLAVSPIIDRLKLATIRVGEDDVPAFALVAALTDIAQVLDWATALPAAFVVPSQDSANPPDNKWSPRQVVIEYVDVLLVARNLSDPRGEAAAADLSVLSAATRASLIGYRAPGRWPLMFSAAKPLGFDDQMFVWQERFETRSELIAVG